MNTIKKNEIIEFYEKKSKFIGYIAPVKNKDEAENFINMIKIKHPDATHNCSAYRGVTSGVEFFKVDDDGEPSGTAGKPMGEIFHHNDLYNVVVVATRYFGGVKLGAGGLIRAYSKTAKLAVEACNIVPLVEKIDIVLDFPYSLTGEVDNILNSQNIYEVDKQFEERVTYRFSGSENLKDEFKNNREIIVI